MLSGLAPGDPIVISEIHRSLIKASGREIQILPHRDCSPAINISSVEKSSSLLFLTFVPYAEVLCFPHATMNKYRRVAISRDLLYSEEHLLEELKVYDVILVKHSSRKVEVFFH